MFVIGALSGLFTLGQPSPTSARANVVCDAGGAVTGGVEAITGGVLGGGNPAQDVCDTVSNAVGGVVKNPVTDALKGIGNGIFEQITKWVSDGAAYLIGEVVKGIQKSTTPQLTAKGFLNQYAKMAAIAAIMAMVMLLLAVLEGVAQGNSAMLVRVVLVNLPLAFIATSVAYVIVQLLLVATDGMCDAISSAAGSNSQHFFEGAIKSLGDAGAKAGGELGGGAGTNPVNETTGKVAVPLFVTFLAAIIGAFAAFLVWIELIMRDSAVYVVASFMPFSLAASIWPRWMAALRRSVELLLVVISSKFVIVAILSMAIAVLADPGEGIEPILAASALMLIACFAPFILMKFVPFAEGAMQAAYSRRSAGGGVIGGVQLASDVAILRGMVRSNMGGNDSGVSLWDAAEKGGGGSPRPGPGTPRGGSGPEGGGSGSSGAAAGGGGAAAGGGAAGGAAAGGGVAGAAAAAQVAASRGGQAAGKKLAQAGGSGEAGGGTASAEAGSSGSQEIKDGGQGKPEKGGAGGGSQSSEKPPRPAPDSPGAKPEGSR